MKRGLPDLPVKKTIIKIINPSHKKSKK